MTGKKGQKNERGFALLIVLWSLVLITLLTTQILSSGRNALNLAANMRAVAQARAADDGAINEAIFHLTAGGAQNWPADGAPHVLGGGALAITVRIKPLNADINPNQASTALLAGLFQACGAQPALAQAVAASVIAWRNPPDSPADKAALLASYKRANQPYAPPGKAFSSLNELGSVLGMTPSLLARAMPYMNLYQSGDPDPKAASPVVRQALKLSGQGGADGSGFSGTLPVDEITAALQGPNGLNLRRLAYVSVSGGNGAAPFQILALQDDPGTDDDSAAGAGAKP